MTSTLPRGTARESTLVRAIETDYPPMFDEGKSEPKFLHKSMSRNTIWGAKFVRRRKQGRVDIIFSQWSNQRSFSRVNNFS